MSNRQINLTDKNIFDERAEAFSSERLSKRLENKCTPKPFEKRWYGVYIVSNGLSWLCNAYSIAAASTFLFVQMSLLFASVPYSFYIALAVTAVLLVAIEVLQRILGPMLVWNCYQYGWKNTYFGIIAAIFVLSAVSLTLSYKGGFDVTDKLTAVPEYVEPELNDIQTIRSHYSTMITDAKDDAEKYKRANSYRGKLDAIRGKEYGRKLNHVSDLRTAMQTAVQAAQTENKQRIEAAKADHESVLADRSAKVSSTGGGMAKGAIIAQLLFFLCIWFMEYYDYSTIKQYAVLDVAAPKQVQVLGFKQQTQTKQAAEKQDTNSIVNSKQQTVKQDALRKARGSLSSYKSRVKKYTEEGKTELAANAQDMVRYWTKKVNELT